MLFSGQDSFENRAALADIFYLSKHDRVVKFQGSGQICLTLTVTCVPKI